MEEAENKSGIGETERGGKIEKNEKWREYEKKTWRRNKNSKTKGKDWEKNKK